MSDLDSVATPTWIETNVPQRMDRLPWSRWHWLVVIGLGVTWILDGLQVTLAGAIGAILQNPKALGLTTEQVGWSASCYLSGAVVGALFFGYATDRFGRKKLFYITLSVYLLAAALTAFSWNFYSYASFMALAGAGIGGEYAAINSAIDELIPARVRGQVDLVINSTYWLGAMLGAGATVILLNEKYFPMWLGWRISYAIGAVLGLGVLLIRHWVPESPRWLMVHGRNADAEAIVASIEKQVTDGGAQLPELEEKPLRISVHTGTPWKQIFKTLLVDQRKRTLLGLVLMSSQAFFYNAIFFTYALVLNKFYKVPPETVSWYILPFALGNLLGPVLLGHFFDTVGRKPMIILTYGLSGFLLAVTAVLFQFELLTPITQSIAWVAIFFIASSAASAAYLTVSELFPLEMRALAIAIFYAAGTLVGGVFAPSIFAGLIATGSRLQLALGYYAGAALMMFAAVIEHFYGVAAERQSLETISPPLSSQE
jgi:MFS family permease